MTPTRLLAALLFASPLVASVPHSAEAEIYRPWCAQYYGANSGGTNCGFTSYEQCMMTARGAAGSGSPQRRPAGPAPQKPP